MVTTDEWMVMAASGVLGMWLWGRGYIYPASAARLNGRPEVRALAVVAPLVALATLYVILVLYADRYVREMFVYQAQYLLLGVAWVAAALALMTPMGLSVRQDMLVRQNPAAALAGAGAMLGLMLSYAGSNVGDGPGWWVVIYCAAWATGTLLGSYLVLELTTHVSERITVERDLSTGLRMGAFMVAGGMIVGRAVAGDWVSTADTIADFYLYASPGAVLLLVAWGMEMTVRVQPYRTRHLSILTGVLPAIGYVAGGAAYVVSRGWWT